MSEQEKETKKIQAVGESEALFQVLFEETADAYLLIEENAFTDCNQSAVKMLGASSKEEVLSLHPGEISPELQPDGRNSGEKADELLQTTLEKGSNRFEWVHQRADGTEFLVEVLLNAISIGERTIIHNVWRDIAERKKTEKEFQASEERFRTIADYTYDWEYWLDADNKFIYVSPSCKRISGYRVDEFTENENLLSEIISPEDKTDWEEHVRTYHGEQSEEVGELDMRILSKDGETRWLGHICQAVHNDEGTWQGRRASNRDITEQKELEAQVQEAFERRGYQVQISTEISQEISRATELSELFDSVVTLSKEQLGYYHTQLLRYDPAQDAVVLIAGYGEIGQKMFAEGHRMAMGSGLIGAAAATGETVIRPTLAEDPDWQPNPLLPETQGEIAVPIKLGDEVLGVLDIQSNTAGALTKDDQLLLEGLCGQIAIAMEQTRLRQDMDERLEEVNRLYRSMSREGWQEYRDTTDLPEGFQYDQVSIRPVSGAALAEDLFSKVSMALPSGEVLGELSVSDDSQNPLSGEDKAFLAQVSEQVALALESARLFEQTQQALGVAQRSEEVTIKQASDLAAVAEISTAASMEPDIEKMLATVVHLTQRQFGLYHAHVFTYNEEADELAIVACGYREGDEHEGTHGITTIPLSQAQSLVARAAREKEAVIVNDVQSEPGWLPNPELPETRAELAVPLLVGDEMLGVLDVQADHINAFSEEDANIQLTLASQIAASVQNANSFALAQKQADREATLNVISQKIQSATSVEAVLQIAARELGQALDAPMTIAQLSLKDKQ